MSAPNPNAGERDLEALRRAQRAHEPSMEEILASIRSIIADDREAAPSKPAPVKPSPLPPGRRSSTPRTRRRRAARSSPLAPKVVWRQPAAEPAAPAPPPPPAEAEALISPQTNQAVSAAFDVVVGEPGAAERGAGREHDARNPAPDAQGLARRASAEHGRTAGARRNSARGARRTLTRRRPGSRGDHMCDSEPGRPLSARLKSVSANARWPNSMRAVAPNMTSDAIANASPRRSEKIAEADREARSWGGSQDQEMRCDAHGIGRGRISSPDDFKARAAKEEIAQVLAGVSQSKKACS